MSHRFTLELTRVFCLTEQSLEWGKDEMRMFGFAVSRKGHLFATGYRSLGSYSTADDRSDGIFPMMLVDRKLESDGLEVLFYVWLIEQDGAGVRDSAAALESEFRANFRDQEKLLLKLGFPRDCIPFTAFYKTALPFHFRIVKAGTAGRNDDVFEPFEIVLDRPADALPIVGSSKEFIMIRFRGGGGGGYQLTFRFRYKPIDVAIG